MYNNQKIPEGWSIKKLGEMGKFVSGGTPDTEKPEYWNGDIIWLTPSEITKLQTRFVSDSERKITRAGLKNSSAVLLPVGSLIICTRATVGDCCINIKEVSTNQGFKNLIPENSNIDFLYYLISSHKTDLIRKACGSTFLEISKHDIEKLKYSVPPLPEQEKIAEILEAWDSAIEKLTALIAAKRLQKKGLVYSYVKNAKDTDLYTISDLFSLTRGRIISKNEIEQNLGIYPVFSSQTSNDGILGYIDSFDYDGEFITWTTDGANAGRVFFRKGRFNCTNVCGLASLKNGISLNLYYTMTYLNLVTKYYVSYVGNPKLMNNAFASISLHLPNIDYQNKVADILFKADEEIDLLIRKLSALKEQKTGLMQKLLTGQIRVKVA